MSPVSHEPDLDGLVAVVTGAGAGLGRAAGKVGRQFHPAVTDRPMARCIYRTIGG